MLETSHLAVKTVCCSRVKTQMKQRQDKARQESNGVWLHGRLYYLINVSAEGDFYAVMSRYSKALWSATCIFGDGRGAWLAA